MSAYRAGGSGLQKGIMSMYRVEIRHDGGAVETTMHAKRAAAVKAARKADEAGHDVVVKCPHGWLTWYPGISTRREA